MTWALPWMSRTVLFTRRCRPIFIRGSGIGTALGGIPCSAVAEFVARVVRHPARTPLALAYDPKRQTSPRNRRGRIHWLAPGRTASRGKCPSRRTFALQLLQLLGLAR